MIKLEAPSRVKLQKPWQRKAIAAGLDCHCFLCLREHGITPGREAHITHKCDVIKNEYRQDNGLILHNKGDEDA